MERKAWKDTRRYEEQHPERAVRTPCDAAWLLRWHREAVYAWLAAGPDAPQTCLFAVRMPTGELRDAVFFRRVQVMTGEGYRLALAVDVLSKAVFAARRWRGEE